MKDLLLCLCLVALTINIVLVSSKITTVEKEQHYIVEEVACYYNHGVEYFFAVVTDERDLDGICEIVDAQTFYVESVE